jgi:hypothetical protein
MNVPVLHHKAGSGGAATLFRQYGQSRSFEMVSEVIGRIHRFDSPEHLARQIKVNATTAAIRGATHRTKQRIHAQFSEWDHLVRLIHSHLSDESSWWNKDQKLRRSAAYLRSNVDLFSSDARQQVFSHLTPAGKMVSALHGYADLIQQWPTVVRAVRKMRESTEAIG